MNQIDLIDIIKKELAAWSYRKDKLFGNSRYLPLIIEYLYSNFSKFEKK